MSKLFNQLKDAARSREEKSPGLLVDALRRQHEAVTPAEGAPAAQQEPAPAHEAAPAAPTSAPPADVAAPSPQAPAIARFSGVGLALVIFLVAVLAWRSAPFTPPRKLRIDPSELKLDRSLDLQRVSPKGTSPAGRPS